MNADLKAMHKYGVKRCIEHNVSTDESTTKHRKYITPTLQNSMHRLASALSGTALLGFFATTSVRRLNQSGCATVQAITSCNKFGDPTLDHHIAKFTSPQYFQSYGICLDSHCAMYSIT